MENFGERLRRLRGNRSQREVASEMGKPQTTLSTLENQRAVPRGKVLQELATFYGVPVSYFLSEGGPTDKAREWLKSVRETSCKGRETVATHAESPVDESDKQAFANWVEKKLGQTSH